MAQLLEGKLDQGGVAQRLAITVRQVKRLKRRYTDDGIAGLIQQKAWPTVQSPHAGAPAHPGDIPDRRPLCRFWPHLLRD